jgi:NtrC-family two-component system response regulator AlgB
MKMLLDAAYKTASTSAPVLLTGETGVGKSVLARQIHEWSSWREQAFVVVDCASISKSLLEGVPFDQVIGLIRSSGGHRLPADRLLGGTFFFNKVSDLSELGQRRFLQFVEEQDFNAVFDQARSRRRHRIIVACNQNLAAKVAAKRFREDLFFKISVINLEVPPLRDRVEDIRALANNLLYNVSLVIERPGLQLSPDAVAVLTRHRWPGNLRELRDAIERAAILSRRDIITSQALSRAIAIKEADLSIPPRSLTSLEEVERRHILRVLSQAGSLKHAAVILGIDLSTLWRKRRRYNLIRDSHKPMPPTP